MENDQTQVIMGLIVNGGNARSLAMKAIYAAKKGDFEEAEAHLAECNDYLVQAHHAQTDLLTKEASGEKTEISLLMVHAQDHLMNAITVKDMATEFVELYKTK
ncbi:PTS lactose/cellobiose transporter subunit IIA [Streptococcus rifensis]